MGSYVPSTTGEQQTMLKALGLSSLQELYTDIPDAIRLDLKTGPELDLPSGLSELEVQAHMTKLAGKNKIFSSIFRGAGAYWHYIPAIVTSVVNKEEFVTAYTPYQAEASQGLLQSIFEYQTMICELTGMAASNASVYDGATAAAEAAAMCRERKRTKTLISATTHPMVIQTVQTYCFGANTELVVVPAKDGVTDAQALAGLLDDTVASLIVQQTNYFGQIEDCAALAEIAHQAGGKFIMSVNPIAVNLLSSPGECGADIAVGEGQPLGMPLSFGGPYLGFMACTAGMMRKLPGRIVGETVDKNGERAYVLTLQAREQHIRREKASSNICSNQALCAMTAAVYMTAMGAEGLCQTARLCWNKAHYLAEEMLKIPGFSLRHTGPFFHEFVTRVPKSPEIILSALEKRNILGGLPVEDGILWCATEMNTKEQIDVLLTILREVCE